MTCSHCHREGCTPIYFILCGECGGIGCELCRASIIPGILRVGKEPLEDVIGVCTQWADPEVDAALDDQRPSLINALTIAREAVIRGE